MQKFIALLCVLFACSPVLAQDKSKTSGKNVSPPPKMTPAQKKEAIAKACEQEAVSLKLKDEPRKLFMKGCLSEPAPLK